MEPEKPRSVERTLAEWAAQEERHDLKPHLVLGFTMAALGKVVGAARWLSGTPNTPPIVFRSDQQPMSVVPTQPVTTEDLVHGDPGPTPPQPQSPHLN